MPKYFLFPLIANQRDIYHQLSVRDDYTIEEWKQIKEWVKKAEQKYRDENTQAWKVRGSPRSSLGKNHQAEIIDITTVTNNEREMTSGIYDYTSKRQLGESGLKYISTNANQLLNKIEYLKMLVADDEPVMIMITEVIPKAQKNPITDTLLSIEGYEVYKIFDEDDSNLGVFGISGVTIYVKNRFICNDVTTEIALHNDQVWIEIDLRGKDKLLCGCVYRSPSNDKDKSLENTRLISHSIRKAMDRKPSHVLIGGDFNFKDIDWENEFVEDNHPEVEGEDETMGAKQHISNFMETLQDLFLKQLVT